MYCRSSSLKAVCDTPIARITCQSDVNNTHLRSWRFLAVCFASKCVPQLPTNREHVYITATEQTTDDHEVCIVFPYIVNVNLA